MKNFIAVLASILGFSTLLVEAQTIKGKINDKSNGETLIGVNIFNQDNVGATTNIDGEYSLMLSVGEQTVTYKFIGYQAFTKKFTLAEGETVEFNAKLSVAFPCKWRTVYIVDAPFSFGGLWRVVRKFLPADDIRFLYRPEAEAQLAKMLGRTVL